MNRDEIKQTINDFLSLIENGCGSPEENAAKLKLLLDKLALAQHFTTFELDEKDDDGAPGKAYEELRRLVAFRFPNYGHYNIAETVTQNIGESNTIVGDAIDDIADIARDLYETKWCWDYNGPEDGLWHFKDSFEMHWAEHLRELQLYLLNLERGT